jgi:hypothetical protein
MSVEAISWALNLAPVPAVRPGPRCGADQARRPPQAGTGDLALARDDLNEPGVTVPESQSPVHRAGLASIEWPLHERPPNAAQPPHPAGLMDHLDHGVQQLHLAAATRCNQRTGGCSPRGHGVQRLHPNRPDNHP